MTDNRFVHIGFCPRSDGAAAFIEHSRCTFDRDEPPVKPVFTFAMTTMGSVHDPGREKLSSCAYLLPDSYIIYLNLSAPIDLHDSLCHLSPVENPRAPTILVAIFRFSIRFFLSFFFFFSSFLSFFLCFTSRSTGRCSCRQHS